VLGVHEAVRGAFRRRAHKIPMTRFVIFYEHQLPRPWSEHSEATLLEQNGRIPHSR
jgi:hypothetical protein